ncbi:hypothetical protein ABH931_002794 [Streptacidiphilus sp. MAP12-33]|uniref:hypothetical protein n=1 Tax=Streptacidiphilus sp. MAP12-33 TaxID=3156266 RepID=UPI0035169634
MTAMTATVAGPLREAAAARLTQALAGRPLVLAERFTTAMRTCYTGPDAIEAARPALSVGCYTPWEPAQPVAALVAETRTGVRGPEQRRSWSADMDRSAQRVLAALATPVIAAWYATDQLRAWAGPGGTLAAIDGGLRARIEDKAFFGQLLTDAQVPASLHIPAIRCHRLPDLKHLQRRLCSGRLVVQAGADSGGRGTFFVTTTDDLARAAAAMSGPYRVSRFVDGWSSNTTVLSVPNRHGSVDVYVDRPSHKAVGVPQAGIGPGKSAGNTWSMPWPHKAAARLVDAAVRIAEWAWTTHRMCGLFGLDAILTGAGRVHLNEINCRNQGTTEVSAVNQQLRGLPPFLIAHLTTLLDGTVDWLPDPDTFNAATITVSARGGPGPFYLKLRNRHPHPVTVDLPGPGLYRITAGRLERLHAAAHPAEARAERNEVLLANLPTPGTVCLPDAELGTAEGLAHHTGGPFAGPHHLSAYGTRILRALDQHLTPCPEPTKEPAS